MASVKFVLLILCLVSCTLQGMAQSSKAVPIQVEKSYVFKLGTTPELRTLTEQRVRLTDKRKYYKSLIRPPRNFIGRYASRDINQRLQKNGPDRLRQEDFLKNLDVIVEPKINIEGISSGFSPNDPTGDAGRDFYMMAVNATELAVFEKVTGDLVDQFSANMLWNELGFNSGGDPIILYDQTEERWLITEFPSGFGANANQLLVAISTGSDPLGSYDVYNFSTPNFPDYPKYAVWSNCYSITTNEQGGGVIHGYYINRHQLLAGMDTVDMQRVSLPGNLATEAGFFVGTPVDWSGTTIPPVDRGPIVLALNDSSWNLDQKEDQIEIFSLELDWDNADNTSWSRLSIEVSPYDSYPCADAGFFFSCIPQPGGTGLDGIPETIMNQAHYRNFGTHESMVFNFITDVTDGENLSGIRWMELRRSNGADWSIYQEGTFAPNDGLHRFMGAIAMDGSGNIGLAYNVSGPTEFAGLRFTGRRAGDPLGIMTVNEYVIVDGMSTINSSSRFGDYAHMTVDPYDDRSFWFAGEYAGAFGTNTRVVSFELTRDSIDIGPAALKNAAIATRLGSAERIEVDIRNFGIQAVDSFELGFLLNDTLSFQESISQELPSDSIYTHSFAQTVDLSSLGTYNFTIFTRMVGDSSIFNDTIRTSIQHIAALDAELLMFTESSVVCGSETILSYRLRNAGFDTISSVTILPVLNGDSLAPVTYSDTIPSRESSVLDLSLSELLDGLNSLMLYVQSVNEADDLIVENDTLSLDLKAIRDGFQADLEILFDDYPEESSWLLVLEDGTEVASGGPYDSNLAQQSITENICLDPDLCYQMIFRDSYGDGISFAGVEGNYQIFDDSGILLTSLIDPDFGDEEVNSFCAKFECSLELTASTAPTSGAGVSDGVIMVEVLNGLGPFNFSLDDGQTVQGSPVFTGLMSGRYTVLVEGANACTDTLELEVLACSLTADYDISPESDIGSNDGVIEVLVMGAKGGVQYSIDGGQNFSSSPVFTDLSVGDYLLVVRDSLSCRYEETVRVANTTSTSDTYSAPKLRIFPNPTDGVFRLELSLSGEEIRPVGLRLYDQYGRYIQSSSLTIYGDRHKGIMSLVNYPMGSYYLMIDHPNAKGKLWQIIRQ